MSRRGIFACSTLLAVLFSTRVYAQNVFEAVRSGKLESVRALIERNPKLLAERDLEKKTPLHLAVESDQTAIARYLLEKGAPVNVRDEKLQTPLYYVALLGGSLEMAKLLIEKGADPNSEDILQTSVLMEAAKSNPKIADYLMESGARLPPAQGGGGKVLLLISARNGLLKIFDRLMAAGVDPFQRDRKGQTALHEAAAGGQTVLIDRLIKAGLRVTDQDLYGWTPLHFAAERGDQEAVARLLDQGAEIDARTTDGNTPYNLAVELENKAAADFLAARGADRSGPKFPVITEKYFGQKTPGKTAGQFAVGIVAARYSHHGHVAFSPDGREAYWAVLDYGKKRQRVILESKAESGRWTPPRLASFCRPGLEDDAPVISPDGRKLFFNSYRPVKEGGKLEKENIWVLDRIGDRWSEPRPLPPAVNSLEDIHHQVSVDLKGNLYFSSAQEGGHGSLDLYISKYDKGTYQRPVNLGPRVNSPAVEYTPFIAPDGSYLIFSRYNPKGWTLFICFRGKNDAWTQPEDMSGTIKGPWAMNMDCPSVTRDGLYLFFAGSFEENIDYNEKPFWVEASLIEAVRPKDKGNR